MFLKGVLTGCALVWASAVSAQIGGGPWTKQPVTFNVQWPYTLPESARYSESNGIYHLWVYSNDPPFQAGNTTLPRTEQRFTPDYTSGEIQYQSTMMVTTNTTAYCIFQIHTGDAQSDQYGSTTFMMFWYNTDGGSVHDYDGTELATNLSGKWFQVNVDHNMSSRIVTVYVNNRDVWQQMDNGAGDFYFKDGVYMQDGASYYMENYVQTNLQIWTTTPPTNILWTAVAGTAANTNWSVNANWTPNGAPGVFSCPVFDSSTALTAGSPFAAVGAGAGGAGIVNPARFNSLVDRGFSGTVSSLTYTNINGSWQNTLLASGTTLNVIGAGGLTVGNGVSGIDYGNTTEFVTIAGSNSTLNISNASANVNVEIGTATNASQTATLDLSGLGTLKAQISQLLVGVPGVNRPGATVYLAATNIISAGYSTDGTETSDTPGTGAIVVGDASSNNGNECALYLGMANTIRTDTIVTGRQKVSHAVIQFNPNLSGGTPQATFTGYGGAQVQVWSIGDGVANSGTTTCGGINDFSAGVVNASVSTMYIGRASTSGSGANASTGTLTFAAGNIAVDNLYVGLQTSSSAAKYGVGTINVKTGGVLSVNDTLYLASTTPSAPQTSGTLNIGGAVQANTIDAGTGLSTINLNGGTLIITNWAGTLSELNLAGGTMQFNVDGDSATTNIIASSVTTSGTTLITIGSVSNVAGTAVFPLIGYAGNDPFSNLALTPLPFGYGGTLVDNTVNKRIDLSLVYAVNSPLVVTNINLAGEDLVLHGTNAPRNGQYIILTATHLNPPVSWIPVFTNAADSRGNWSFTNANVTGSPECFYRVIVP